MPSTTGPERRTSRGSATRVAGAAGAVAGAVAWGLAVAATDAARAAELALVEAGVPPGEDPSSVDSPGTVDLLLHDVRLGALVAVLLAVALMAPAGRRGEQGQCPRWPVLLGGGTALVVGNAVVPLLTAPLVDALPVGAGPAEVVLGAVGLLALTTAGCAAGAVWAARRPGPARTSAAEPHPVRGLALAGAAAGTAGALGVWGAGEGWGPLHVRPAAAAAALAVVALTAVAVVAVLGVRRVGGPWRLLLAVVAAAPGALSVGALLTEGSPDDLVLVAAKPVVLVLLPLGLLSLVLTGPAGAVMDVDGVPLVGGGAPVGALAGLVVAVLLAGRPGGDPDAARTADEADETGGAPEQDRAPTVTP